MESARPRLLVTGGAGYIGSYTCKALASAGFEPIVLDNLSTGHENFVRWGPFILGDVLDSNLVRDIIAEYNIETVIHFAAKAYIGESVTDPHKYYLNNVAGTLSLLEGMLSAGCKRMVFSSTCAVYGDPINIPIIESHPLRPINPYGMSKSVVEKILTDYAAAYDFKFIALRYFNACGADSDLQTGELRNPETHLIPRAMMCILGYLDEIEIYGTDFPTKDGTAVRDYIHVVDLATAHVAAAREIRNAATSSVYNLGTGTGYSVREVLDSIQSVAGINRKWPARPRRPGDPPNLVANASKAIKDLHWFPNHSSLNHIVKSAWAWHQHVHPKKAV